MKKEIFEKISPKEGGIYLDATLGGGGHTLDILNSCENITVISIDRDIESIERFKVHLKDIGFQIDNFKATKDQKTVHLSHNNFSAIDTILKELNVERLNGIIADLGFSTDQLEDPQRGFSYRWSEKLDLRMDTNQTVKATDLLNGLYEKELSDLFFKLADITSSRILAKEIIKARNKKPIESMKDLLKILDEAFRFKPRNLTARVLQALRIAVNDEFHSLQLFLPHALEALAIGSAMCILTFHSGEDRIVKRFFKENSSQGELALLYPTKKEIYKNPKAESAKLRVFIKKP